MEETRRLGRILWGCEDEAREYLIVIGRGGLRVVR